LTSHKIVPATIPLNGPHKIAFIGEAPGENEEREGEVFIGAAGVMLDKCCKLAGISRGEAMITNVFNFRPPGNNIDAFCGTKKEVGGAEYKVIPLGAGQYVKPQYLSNLARLKSELSYFKPNIAIALGNTALWALCNVTGIGKYRGGVMESTLVPGLKVIPTWHPASVLRKYDNKVVLVADLIKARGEAEYREIRRTQREIWIYPEIKDLYEWSRRYGSTTSLLSVDIETKAGRFISCVGFAFTKDNALVVPFWDPLREGNSYWRTLEEEVAAWNWVRAMLTTYPCRKLGQNYIAYDSNFLLTKLGIFTRHFEHDCMIAAHAQQPEMEKGLGFLTSVHCNEPAYKTIRPRGYSTAKREE